MMLTLVLITLHQINVQCLLLRWYCVDLTPLPLKSTEKTKRQNKNDVFILFVYYIQHNTMLYLLTNNTDKHTHL